MQRATEKKKKNENGLGGKGPGETGTGREGPASTGNHTVLWGPGGMQPIRLKHARTESQEQPGRKVTGRIKKAAKEKKAN